jgi:prevent-host-death family protein
MPISTASSREFNQHTNRAKKAARSGPVIITERGRPAYVLLTFEEYQRLAGSKENIVERLGQPPRPRSSSPGGEARQSDQ